MPVRMQSAPARSKKITSASASFANPRRLTVSLERLRIFCALMIGILLSFIPWPDIVLELSGQPMWDRDVYIKTIEAGTGPLSYFHYETLVSFVTHEYLWAWLMDFLHRARFVSYELVFQAISTATLSAAAVILARRKSLLFLIFLLNPLIIDLAYSQLRLALAMSLLLWILVLRVNSPRVVFPLLITATLIHTGMLIFFAAHFVATMTRPDFGRFRWSAGGRMAMLLCFGLAVGIMVGPLREILLSAVGDRRAQYHDMSSSLLYLSFWIGLFFLLVFDQRRTLIKYESRYSVAILGIIFINAFTGFYSTRFIAAIFPFLIVAIFGVLGKNKFLVSIPFLIYFLFQWYYYLRNLLS